MAYAEQRGKKWRARWRGPDGSLAHESGFDSKDEAIKYGRDQEAAIRNHTYRDPRVGKITVTEWANMWFSALNLELSTLDNYRYYLESFILPEFGEWSLRDLEARPEDVAKWERSLPVSQRTAREARSTLTNLLNDAIPRYLSSNPATRRRGKGKKGQRRIAEAERQQKVWATPFQVLLLAERCAALTGDETDFIFLVTAGFTGARWGELLALSPRAVRPGSLDIHRKIYELNGRFYLGRPKDGSMRTIDTAPFLDDLLGRLQPRRCQCRGTKDPWCRGDQYLFLTKEEVHYRRSNYSTRVFGPATDAVHVDTARKKRRSGTAATATRPVLVDMRAGFPGVPVVPAWPRARAEEPFTPPTGRGVPRLVSVDDGRARCAECERTQLVRTDGTLIKHKNATENWCPGAGKRPAEDVPVASWVPLIPSLTPHGLRHGHQTALENAGISYVLVAERMGHEVPGMRGVYTHPTAEMRASLVALLERLWRDALGARAALHPRSAVPLLDELLASYKAD